MTLRATIKKVLARVAPRSVYVAVNARVAARDIASGRRYAPEIDLLPRFVHAGDTVVDVGANHGMYTYHLSRLVGPTGTVHAFEPIPANLNILRHTVRSLRLENVSVHPQACGEHAGRVSFSVPEEHGVPQLARARPGAAGEEFSCEVVRLDDSVDGRVSFLKIDVEGAELFVLRGAERMLRESKPVVLFEAGDATAAFGYEQEAVFDYLRERGYRFCSGGFRGKPLEPRERFTLFEDYFALPE